MIHFLSLLHIRANHYNHLGGLVRIEKMQGFYISVWMERDPFWAIDVMVVIRGPAGQGADEKKYSLTLK